ncbi:MAG: hypothetical protein LBK73_07435 [Treponema sp.]|nr:hypothetical protein [Treponema sp.]
MKERQCGKRDILASAILATTWEPPDGARFDRFQLPCGNANLWFSEP